MHVLIVASTISNFVFSKVYVEVSTKCRLKGFWYCEGQFNCLLHSVELNHVLILFAYLRSVQIIVTFFCYKFIFSLHKEKGTKLSKSPAHYHSISCVHGIRSSFSVLVNFSTKNQTNWLVSGKNMLWQIANFFTNIT